MKSGETVVIVGAGQAGGELATRLRQQGSEGRIVLVGDEAHLPYQRPPLSKGFLLGKMGRDDLHLKPQATYERFSIELKLGTRVERIERDAHEVLLSEGSRLRYDKLVLATGGRARLLSFPGMDTSRLENVFSLRSIADVEAMHGQFVSGRHLVIIGGGYVGLEVAAAATQLGLRVTVVEAAPRILARVTGPEVSSFIEAIHRGHGVDFRQLAGVQGFELDESQRRVRRVKITHGGGEEALETDLVLVGIGLIPNTELAAQAGLAVDNGIVVDELARTSDPSILAIGDCANQPSSYTGTRVRLESVPNALEHARVAAATLMGKQEPSSATPWFWSEQYDLKLQMVGLSTGYERCVTRGSIENRTFSAFYLKEGRILAADVIGRPPDFMAARKMVSSRTLVDAQRLADESVPLGQCAV
ncbi:Ferredoxin reductase [Cystobacter fuscus DSM 2262]|uniref:Ferredoxin reductase n=1 Tax=Cystobacter fuscus (strain ATCC 25194 / DSM 2262 / NBRC 100088 / M29) TaxID=1242864 RepID=S9P155_CYSF2|nr:FAD-dependent oxidoreductase [Cystobacter fuscus]EPX58175.1 Ferredoxin reductase [Cystobacter fuscus DSM 2262]